MVYISCNPETLHANLKALEGSHKIEKMAAFDQFPCEYGCYWQLQLSTAVSEIRRTSPPLPSSQTLDTWNAACC